MESDRLIHVALPLPPRRVYDYKIATHIAQSLSPGCRVVVPFGNRILVGYFVRVIEKSDVAEDKLKNVESVLDSSSVFSESQWQWLIWASDYYLHSLGDVLQTSLPVKLRGQHEAQAKIQYWMRSALGKTADLALLSNAPKQLSAMHALAQGDIRHEQAVEQFGHSALKSLEKKHFIEVCYKIAEPIPWYFEPNDAQHPVPNVEQSLAISVITRSLRAFACYLLEGVTGSGKTEVYLQTMSEVLAKGQQVLILLPEIGLTPQMLARFAKRFALPIGVLHSSVTDTERLKIWRQAKNGELAIIIGTRSAIFTSFNDLGLIVVDEEHDGSYKQQEGFRYHARDIAVTRAHHEQCPVVLGSATPSFESLNNVKVGKYRHLVLPNRAGEAKAVLPDVVDVRNQTLHYGLSQWVADQIRAHLARSNQVMLFVNRRGYAPALICHQCGQVEQCQRCSGNLTLHYQSRHLECHHCGARKPIPSHCQSCGSAELNPVGSGTEQIEQGCSTLFPEANTIRVDSDNMRGKDRLNQTLEAIWKNEYQIIIGTQMLSKGHHFPNVTLVVIVDVDSALFSADYRASEHLAQLITQVSGRAGREQAQGYMLLQTAQPGHPLLQEMVHNGYQDFARLAMQERHAAQLPPYAYQALFRAQSANREDAFAFLLQVQTMLSQFRHWQLVGPLPALMEKRQGKYRFQLLVQTQHRQMLSHLAHYLPQIETLPQARKVRWSLDRDPQDFV